MPKQPAPKPPATQPKVGTLVRHVAEDGTTLDALVIRVPPGEPDRLDLVVYRAGEPHALARVPRGSAPGCWHATDEAPPRPKTLVEELGDLEAQGQPVPRPGMWVTYLKGEHVFGPPRYQLFALRARVAEVHDADTVSLHIHEGAQPPPLGEPDPVLVHRPRVERLRKEPRGSAASHRWVFTSEIASGADIPAISAAENHPDFLCEVCGKSTPWADLHGIRVSFDLRDREKRACGTCHAAFQQARSGGARPVGAVA